MPKVIIWREGAIETEFDPGHRDWRMGRSETNDITLLDPRKSVSRFHAELREENGRWVFIDLNSQNGSWKDGQRVNRLVLEHGHEVLFGDYKLSFQDVKVTVPPVPDGDVTADDKGAPADIPVTPDHTLVVKTQRAVPATPPAAPPPPLPAREKVTAARKGINPAIPVLVVLALLGLGLIAAIVWKIFFRVPAESGVVENTAAVTPEPARTPAPIPAPAPAAPDTPDPTTPTVAPGDTPVTPPQPPVSTPPVAPAPPATVETPPSATGAKATPKRTTARPKPVPPTPKDDPVVLRYDDGRRALNAGRYAQAEIAFQWVLQQQPGFRDTAALLAQARAGLSAAREKALADGRALEASGNWAQAIAAYERAGATDQAAAARKKMTAEGENAYRKARQFDARNRVTDAVTWYEHAVEWLPDDDARKATARQRIAALKAGGA